MSRPTICSFLNDDDQDDSDDAGVGDHGDDDADGVDHHGAVWITDADGEDINLILVDRAISPHHLLMLTRLPEEKSQSCCFFNR